MIRKYIVVFIFFIVIIISTISYAQKSPSPVIKSVVPKTGLAHKETLLTVEGENIFRGARVIIGKKHSATIAFFPSKKIVVYSPPRPPGTVDITVINTDGQLYTMTKGFRYVTKAEQLREENKTSSLDMVDESKDKESLKSLLRSYRHYVVKALVYGGMFIFLFIVLSMNRKNRLIKKINKEKKKYFRML